MKYICFFTMWAFMVACGGSTSNPQTVERGDLNSPANLVSLTQSKKLTLTFDGTNVEDDFQGYYVFAAKGTISEILNAAPIAYPSVSDVDAIVNNTGVPRCKSNNAFFATFGFAAVDDECEGDIASDDAEDSDDGADDTEEPEEVEEEDEDAALKNFIPCAENTADETISYKGEAPLTERVECTISKYWNGTELADMEDGEPYTIFVTAVQGDDKDEISWSSNIIYDVPSTRFGETIEIATKEWVSLSLDATESGDKLTVNGVTLDTGDCVDVSATGATMECRFKEDNTHADDAIFIGRDNVSSSIQQRYVISASTNSSYELVGHYYANDTGAEDGYAYAPGDMALPADANYIKGGKLNGGEKEVIDFIYTSASGNEYFGKIIIHTATFADTSSTTSTLTLELEVVVQPLAGERNYFQN